MRLSDEEFAKHLARIRSGEIARETLVLPPGKHEHGAEEAALARTLAHLGAPYLPELLQLVEQTTGLTHDVLIHELKSAHRQTVPDELLPVVEAILRRTEPFGRKDAAWLAVSCRERAQPLLDALLFAVQTGDHETKRGALTALSYLHVPPERALPIIEPLLEPLLSTTPNFDRVGMANDFLFRAVLEALAAVEPPPVHLADRVEAALGPAFGGELPGPGEPLVRLLAKLRPARVIELLSEVPDLATFPRTRRVIACLATDAIPAPLRIHWIARLLVETSYGDAIRFAGKVLASSQPIELLAPLVHRFRRASGHELATVVELLLTYERTAMRCELAPLLVDPAATVRRRGLDVLFAMHDGDAIAHVLGDADPRLARRAARWLVLHGGASLLAHVAPSEPAC